MTRKELVQVLDMIGDTATAGKGIVSLHPDDYASVLGVGVLSKSIASGSRLFEIKEDASVLKGKPQVKLLG